MIADRIAARYATHPDFEDLRQEARLAEIKGGGATRVAGAMKDALRKQTVVSSVRRKDAEGNRWTDIPQIADLDRNQRAPESAPELTPRQIEIARMTVNGMEEREISHKLGISVNTVQTHRRRLYKKLLIKPRNRGSGAIAVYKQLGKAIIERIPCPKCGYRRGI